MRKYRKLNKHKIYQKNYQKKYRQSEHGKQIRKNYVKLKKINYLHNPIAYLKRHGLLIFENCAICDSHKKIECHHPNIKLPLHVYFLCKKCHREITWRR